MQTPLQHSQEVISSIRQKSNAALLFLSEPEIWNPVFGWEGVLKISNYGDIVRLPQRIVHVTGKVLNTKERRLKPHLSTDGYLRVQIKDSKGKTTAIKIHIAVYKSFKGELDKGCVIDHFDQNKLNNYLGNLRSVTHRGNAQNKPNNVKLIGVYKKRSKYYSSIVFKGKSYHLGSYNTQKEARSIYVHCENLIGSIKDFDFDIYHDEEIRNKVFVKGNQFGTYK